MAFIYLRKLRERILKILLMGLYSSPGILAWYDYLIIIGYSRYFELRGILSVNLLIISKRLMV